MSASKTLKILIPIVGLFLILAVIFAFNSGNFRESGFTFGTKRPLPPLKVGTHVWPGYEPLYLARELGFYDQSTIRLVEYTSATQVIRAYRNNAIQVAALTMDEVMLLLENGLDPHVVLVMDISNGGDAILAKPEIKNLEDLRGKRVGVESTALGAFFLNQALATVKLHPSEINIISSDIDEHEGMFERGELDAVVTFEPVQTRLLSKGAHPIFDSSQIAGEIVDVLVIAKETHERFPKEVEILLRGWFKSLDYLRAKPMEAASILARRLKVSDEEVLASYEKIILPDLEENLNLMVGSPEAPLKVTAAKLAEVMLENNLLQNEVTLAHFIDPSTVKAIMSSTPNN